LSETISIDYEDKIKLLLGAIRRGDAQSLDQLVEALGSEMRKISAYRLRQQPRGVTFQTTALVNEAIIGLIQRLNQDRARFPDNKEHLMALMSTIMHFKLIDRARKQRMTKVSIDEPHGDAPPLKDSLPDLSDLDVDLLLVIEEVLESLKRSDPELGPRRAAALELHLFGGMNFTEIAAELGVTDDMARRDCKLGLTHLRVALKPSNDSR
jgi:RNA polymerase sigma factor (TIGR02999 family)